MTLDAKTQARLLDMLTYAREAVAFVGHLSATELASDRRTLMAALHAVQIVGEAASRVSPEMRQTLPAIPWREAIAMRSILVHDYGRIDPGILVDTLAQDFPGLIAELERALSLGSA